LGHLATERPFHLETINRIPKLVRFIKRYVVRNNKNEKPVMLYVAEIIYKEVSKIKKENPNIPNVEAIERFIGTEIYNLIGSGEFHNNLYKSLLEKKNINNETSKLLDIQKKAVMSKFGYIKSEYFAKSKFPLSETQSAHDLLWRMCESYELWCKETDCTNKIKLNLI
tara:strand:- start:1303 stop:1806 length:504 start_codon:yes stop_codon:yes gene_type:complete